MFVKFFGVLTLTDEIGVKCMGLVRSLCLAAMFGSSNMIYAAGNETGKIEPGWQIYGDGNIFFYLSGTHQSSACATIPERWAFDTTSTVGKSLFSAFLTAYASGKEITVSGTGNCVHGNSEGVWTFAVK